MFDDIPLRSLRNGYDSRRPAAKQRHRQVQIVVIELFVVFGEQLKDEIMYGQDSGNGVQGHQQVFGAVEEGRIGEEAVKGDAGEMGQPDGHPPRFVPPVDLARGQMAQAIGPFTPFAQVVKEGHLPRSGVGQGAGHVFAVPP